MGGKLPLASASSGRLGKAPPAPRFLTQRPKAGTDLVCQKLWLFPSGKMSALGEDIEVEEIVVGALRPTPWSLINLLREDADGSRYGDAQVVEKAALELRVEPSGRHPGVRQPGQRDVVEDVVPRKVAVGLPIHE